MDFSSAGNSGLRWVSLLILTVAAAMSGCRGGQVADEGSTVAVTASYLQCAVGDVSGSAVSAISLAPPGMCPGHYDIRPSQVAQLRRCRLLVRFDFQKDIDAKFAGLARDGLKIVEIAVGGGLCQPDSYASACRRVGDALVAEGLADRTSVDGRLKRIDARMAELGRWVRNEVERAGLSGKSVICSVHQSAFCRWMGLNVAATFSSADVTRIGEIDKAVTDGRRCGVKIIVANLPEGRRLADALADRLAAKVVVFSNFPTGKDGLRSFDDLLRDNVGKLIRCGAQ